MQKITKIVRKCFSLTQCKVLRHFFKALCLQVALLGVSINSSNAQLTCDRNCLEGFVSLYFDALISNDATTLPLAEDLRLTENGMSLPIHATFWETASSVSYRWDIVNTRLGDTGTEAIIENSDGSQTMMALRLKVEKSQITEIETIKVNEGDAGRLWNPEDLLSKSVSHHLKLSIVPAERDSYYRLIAAAESYWRAFQTNGTPEYHPADLLPDINRFENGLQTTGYLPNGTFRDTAQGFHQGSFIGRNLWDRRYSVVDEERGIVLSMVRFGLKEGMESQSTATSNARIVAEFFTVKKGMIQEIHAVLFNVDDDLPTYWDADYGPDRGAVNW